MKRTLNDIAIGKSKATVLSQSEVIELFFNYKSLHHNVHSVNNVFEINDNVLFHNGAVELVRRKKDGLIIKNSQELQRSGGLMNHVTCPSLYYCKDKHVSLPLEEINNQLDKTPNRVNMVESAEEIEIIDTGDNDDNEFYVENTGIVIKLKEKYFWYRRDERHFYLIQLPTKVSSVKEANESLKPELIKNMNESDYKRQGDFYFIPLSRFDQEQQFENIDKLYYKKHWHIDYSNSERLEKQIEEIGDLLMWKFGELFEKTFLSGGNIEWSSVINDIVDQQDNYFVNPLIAHKKQDLEYIINRINKLIPYTSKELIRYDIYDSNHIADNSANIGMIQFVKGFIHHKNKDHDRIKLDNWHLVLKNESIQGIEVDPNRSRGFD